MIFKFHRQRRALQLVILIKLLPHIYLYTAGPNWLKFVEETHGYPWGNIGKIPRATPGTSVSILQIQVNKNIFLRPYSWLMLYLFQALFTEVAVKNALR